MMIGENLKAARKKSGLNLRELAEKCGDISHSALSKFERGELCPDSKILSRLSKALDVPFAYFFKKNDLILECADFRAPVSVKMKEKEAVKIEVLQSAEKYCRIERLLGFDMRAISFAAQKKITVPADAEEIADTVRGEWRLGTDPIPDITELLEQKGFKVILKELPEKISGMTCKVRDKEDTINIPVIIVNKNHGFERRRFTLAHELAHQIIDASDVSAQEAEKASDIFAGAFLMPKTHLKETVGEKRSKIQTAEIMKLKHIYRVSAASFFFRLKQTEIITESFYTGKIKFGGAKNWRLKEPEPICAESPEFETPTRFQRLCYRAFSEEYITLSKFAELLDLSPDVAVEELARSA